MTADAWLTALIFLAALLYSSVGHAGASGYLAAMALAGIEPAVMKPAALSLNVLVAAIATIRYSRLIPLPWQLLRPLILSSVPMAFVGGAIELPEFVFSPIVGAVLLFAAVRSMTPAADHATAVPSLIAMLSSGAAIGFLSSLTGTGGSIFLSPLVLSMGWATIRETAGIAAVFVLVNSIAGLAGNLASVQYLPPQIAYWGLAAAAGAVIGTQLGARKLSPKVLQYILAGILAAAGIKMLLAWSALSW